MLNSRVHHSAVVIVFSMLVNVTVAQVPNMNRMRRLGSLRSSV